MANWYAVYTRPECEKKVADELTRKKIENYCPIVKVVNQWSDRKKGIYKPLFTSYVFVRLSSKELTQIRMIDGVINMVYWLGKPAVVRDIEIDMMKRFLSEHPSVELEKTTVNVNEIVRIVKGSLIESEGSVVGVSTNKVKLVLPTLGYSMVAEVSSLDIEVVSKNERFKPEISFIEIE
jgi:transcription antitermination factor NusG